MLIPFRCQRIAMWRIGKRAVPAGGDPMFLNLLRGQQMSHGFWKDAAGAEHALMSMQPAPDDQLVADCRSYISRMDGLLDDIEQAAACDSGGQGLDQASLCEAEDQALDLVSRIVVTRACTNCGVQSKHAVADVMLASDWYDEPSPYRDALLHSFVLD